MSVSKLCPFLRVASQWQNQHAHEEEGHSLLPAAAPAAPSLTTPGAPWVCWEPSSTGWGRLLGDVLKLRCETAACAPAIKMEPFSQFLTRSHQAFPCVQIQLKKTSETLTLS